MRQTEEEIRDRLMLEQEIRSILKGMFRQGEIAITTDVINQSAECGDGQWNTLKTTIRVDGEIIHEQESEFNLIESR